MRRTADPLKQAVDGRLAEAVSLDEPLLDAEQAAKLLNVRVSWIREATRTGLLPCIKVGRQVRWTKRMLEGWLTSRQMS